MADLTEIAIPGQTDEVVCAVSLSDLARLLPPSNEASKDGPMETRARAVISILLDRILCIPDGAYVAMSQNHLNCPNCDKPCNSDRSPYCGEVCREQASFVRQFRSGLRDSAITDETRQIAIGQNLWHLLGGGYPLRQSLVPDQARLKVIEKAGGHCYWCENPATAVDHIATACNRPINLRAVCANCSRTIAFGDQVLLAKEEAQSILQMLAMRIGSPFPVRCCDDGENWDWRSYVKARRG